MSKQDERIQSVLLNWEAQEAKATNGPWEVADSCSWRRIVHKHTGSPVIEPTVACDGHPDLSAKLADLEYAAAARTTLPAAQQALENLFLYADQVGGHVGASIRQIMVDAFKDLP